MEPLVISHGYGLPGIQLAHQLGVWKLLEQRYLTLRSGEMDDFLEEEVEKNHTVFPMLGRGLNPSHDINHAIDHSLWFCVSSWTSSV